MSEGNGELSSVEKRSNIKLIVGITIIIILVIASIGAVMLFPDSDIDNSGMYGVTIRLETINTDNAWIVKIVNISGNYDDEWLQQRLNVSYANYKLYYNRSETSPYNLQFEESSPLTEINVTQSPMGVLWVNLNDTNLVEVGDYLIVNKSGGSKGKAAAHDLLFLECPISGGADDVYLPPDDFLDMNMEKTSDGWNMTVTYVDETMPEGLLSDYNVSFRLENQSGLFFTNGTPAWSSYVPEEYRQVSLNLIDNYWEEVGSSHYNERGYYNITWFDNDRNKQLSVNDSFTIEMYSETIEVNYTFRLIEQHYGYIHTIYETTLP